MANWAWPHTPSSTWARLLLTGGPFDGEEAGFVPPDVVAPVQVAWTGFFPWGFAAYLYEWHGETRMDRGRTDALVFHPARRLTAEEVPYAVAESGEVWASGATMILDYDEGRR